MVDFLLQETAGHIYVLMVGPIHADKTLPSLRPLAKDTRRDTHYTCTTGGGLSHEQKLFLGGGGGGG